jgi:hypothetical protein
MAVNKYKKTDAPSLHRPLVDYFSKKCEGKSGRKSPRKN